MSQRPGNLTEVECPECGTEVEFPCVISIGYEGEDEVNWNVKDARFNCPCFDDATPNEQEKLLDLISEQARDSDYDYD